MTEISRDERPTRVRGGTGTTGRRGEEAQARATAATGTSTGTGTGIWSPTNPASQPNPGSPR